jgi:hypothetical protein
MSAAATGKASPGRIGAPVTGKLTAAIKRSALAEQMARTPSNQHQVKTAYRRLVKAGGKIMADGQLIGVDALLTGGCLDNDGLASLARNMEDLAIIAEGLKVPNAYRPDNIPEGANPTLKIKCGTGGNQRFDWKWSGGTEKPVT